MKCKAPWGARDATMSDFERLARNPLDIPPEPPNPPREPRYTFLVLIALGLICIWAAIHFFWPVST